MVLTVIEEFLDHFKGEVIADAKLIKKYIESEWQNHFVKTAAPPGYPVSKPDDSAPK